MPLGTVAVIAQFPLYPVQGSGQPSIAYLGYTSRDGTRVFRQRFVLSHIWKEPSNGSIHCSIERLPQGLASCAIVAHMGKYPFSPLSMFSHLPLPGSGGSLCFFA